MLKNEKYKSHADVTVQYITLIATISELGQLVVHKVNIREQNCVIKLTQFFKKFPES